MKEKPAKPKEKPGHRSEAIENGDEAKRLNRLIGQIEGVKHMLAEQRPLDDVLIQCKAVHSALKSIEVRLLRRHLEEALADIGKAEKRKAREQKIAELLELFKPTM